MISAFFQLAATPQSMQNLLLNHGFTTISDTGSGTSEVIIMQHSDNPHKFKIYYSAAVTAWIIKVLRLDGSTLFGTQGGVYESLYANQNLRFVSGLNVFGIFTSQTRAGLAFVSVKDSQLGWITVAKDTYNNQDQIVAAKAGSDTVYSLSGVLGSAAYSTAASPIIKKTVSNKQLLTPIYMHATYFEDTPIANLFMFPNVDNTTLLSVVYINGKPHVVSTSGNTNNQLLVRDPEA